MSEVNPEPKDGYKEFNWDHFEKMCALPPIIKQEDIAFIMGVSVDTCVRKIAQVHPDMTFADFRRAKQQHMNMMVLSKQYEKALKDNYWPALKWLGINYAGQKDHVLVEEQLQDRSGYDVEEL